jgi:hypothetical protein
MAFPRKIDILRAVAHFQIHPTGKFGREPESGDKPDTDQISNILDQRSKQTAGDSTKNVE